MSTVKPSSQRTLGKIVEEAPVPAVPAIPAIPAVFREQLRHCFIPANKNGCLGLHLSRTPWDPYPWVSEIVQGSCAEVAGVRIGDCVLEANGEDLLGLKVIDIAKRVRDRRNSPAGVGLLLWNSGFEKNNLNPQSLSRFANCLQGIAGLLECPICLEIIRPPSWQCNHGHLICSGCRSRTTKCPICRDVLGRSRCIVADKLFHYLVQTLGHEADQHHPAPLDAKSQDTQRHAHGPPSRPGNVPGRLPLVLRACQRRPSPQKDAPKLKANIAPHGSPTSPVAFHCPTGQPCARMKSQHDILIHLQKAHQTGVVQYYATPGDTVDVTLSDSGPSLACLVLLPTVASKGDDGQGPDGPTQVFFVAKFRSPEERNESLCWLWRLGDDPGCGRFQVQLVPIAGDDLQSTSPWQGRPVSLACSCQEVLKTKRFVRVQRDVRKLRVRILIEADDPGSVCRNP